MEEGDLISLTIAQDEAGERLDKILANRYKDERSRTYFHMLFNEKLVWVNGCIAKKQMRPQEGDTVDVLFLMPPEVELIAEDIALDILYEDNDLIVINKPAGIVVHPAPGNWRGTIVNALLYHIKELVETFPDSEGRPGVVHRLDKDTSGVLVAAKSTLAHKRLVKLFSERKVYKEYIAICLGNPGRGLIEMPITRHPVLRKKMNIAQNGGKEAVTAFETLATNGEVSLVKVILKTGRTHQIRVHMQHKGCPLLGDNVYGHSQANRKYGAKRQLLHAYRLEFLHPISKKPMQFEAPIPDDILKWMEKLK